MDAAAYIEALRRERAGYLQLGHTDRAEQVSAVLAELGAAVDTDAPRKRRPTRRTATKDAPAAST